jgi:hypothetical protein
MVVIGYKANANFLQASNVIRKHTNMDAKTAGLLVSRIREGEGVNLPDDFVLREDLEDLNFLVK